MTYGGEALGRADGRAIFVTGGLPGEVARVAITEERKHFARGCVLDVLEPSPDRTLPRCPHFGFDDQACGGCHWQHIDYAAQLRFKRDIVRDQLRRLGKIEDAPVRETIPSPNVWAYRNHAQFSVNPIGQPGFQAARSHRTVPIRECHTVEPEILQWLKASQQVSQSASRRIGVRSRTAFCVHDVELQVSDESFFQVNTSLIETLIDQVLARLELRGTETVLDAYCGAGLFSRFIARRAARVIGIESNRSASADARVNLAAFDHIALHTGAVEDVLPGLTDHIDALVVDPPRAGCAPAVVRAVIAQQIDRVVYVSCDPATLARDVRILIDHGYALIDVQPIDLFPQTYHIETVALLLRSNRAIL
ncbi:MAG: class I SAM-dependent RNA methyltransferase [Chloroflexi bacterium]|nr:class I SAM-dependent RNA methyltransferase [Chloroflexota bacterium]